MLINLKQILKSMKYYFNAITPMSTVTRNDWIAYSPISESNRSLWKLKQNIFIRSEYLLSYNYILKNSK